MASRRGVRAFRNKPSSGWTRILVGQIKSTSSNMPIPPRSPNLVRPKRFAVELLAEFRPHDSQRWWEAKTENISANGALLRTSRQVPPLTPLDVKLQLPTALTGESKVQLLCSGYVVRAIEPRLPFAHGQLAATFLHFELSNGKAGSSLRQAQQVAVRGEAGKLVHRLNTLLFVILGNAELLLAKPGDEKKVRNYTVQMQQAAEEAARLVRELGTTMTP